MSLREQQQMNLDTESSTHTGMEGQSRLCHRYQLLQVWCGLLTVAIVVMAVLFTSVKLKSTEDVVSTCIDSSTVKPYGQRSTSEGSSFSYIELMKHENGSWVHQETLSRCQSCSLFLRNDSIHCTKKGLYFFYAQVTFIKNPEKNQYKYVILKRDATTGKTLRKLVEGTFPNTTEGSVWVAKIIHLDNRESVSLDITDDFLVDSTFWGAYQLEL